LRRRRALCWRTRPDGRCGEAWTSAKEMSDMLDAPGTRHRLRARGLHQTRSLLLTAAEAAILLGRSVRWVYREASRGQLPARRFGRTVLFSRIELLRWAGGDPDSRNRRDVGE
jgi:excisionase family DNA binding protein